MAADPTSEERVARAGTTVRFVLLVALMVVASGSLMLVMASRVSEADNYGCAFAAGADFNQSAQQNALVIVRQNEAYAACEAQFYPPPPWWITAAWPLLVLVLAVVLFWWLPRWKGRAGRVVPLAAVDPEGILRRELDALVTAAGLNRMPCFVVRPAALSASAVVFGRNRQPTICLHGGLLASRTTNPEGFHAVVLHELAHIRNGDVTLAYVTVAVWRVFLAAVLLPYLVFTLVEIFQKVKEPMWDTDPPVLTRAVLLTLALCVLLYLARSEVLRAREVHADLTAVHWGADIKGWAVPTPAVHGWARRVLSSFVELWRSHPRWDLRREALTDSSGLLGVRALPMFLTGAAAGAVSTQLNTYLTIYGVTDEWTTYAAHLAAAALVVGIVGAILWQAVIHAGRAGRPVPSGVRAGAWLGLGMVAADLVVNESLTTEWLPSRPWALLLPVLAAIAVTWWTARSIALFTADADRRTTHRFLIVTMLGSSCLMLTTWFVWWSKNNISMLEGWPYSIEALRISLASSLPGELGEHTGVLHAVATVFPVYSSLSGAPVMWFAVMAAWSIPLLAWIRLPRDAALPRLGQALWPGVAGGTAGFGAVVIVRIFVRDWPGQRSPLDVLAYVSWVFAALTAGTLVAAVLAAAWAQVHRLPITLIAAGTSALLGFTLVYLTAAADGCVQGIAALQPTCGWRPAGAWSIFEVLLIPLFAFAVIAACTVAALASVVRRRRPRALLVGNWNSGAQQVGATALVIAAVVVFTAGVVPAGQTSSPINAQSIDSVIVPLENTRTSARTKAHQIASWMRHGGKELAERYAAMLKRLGALLDETLANDNLLDVQAMRVICVEAVDIGNEARDYFAVPDTVAQQNWHDFFETIKRGGDDCIRALEQEDEELLYRSLPMLTESSGRALSAMLSHLGQIFGV